MLQALACALYCCLHFLLLLLQFYSTEIKNERVATGNHQLVTVAHQSSQIEPAHFRCGVHRRLPLCKITPIVATRAMMMMVANGWTWTTSTFKCLLSTWLHRLLQEAFFFVIFSQLEGALIVRCIFRSPPDRQIDMRIRVHAKCRMYVSCCVVQFDCIRSKLIYAVGWGGRKLNHEKEEDAVETSIKFEIKHPEQTKISK